MQQTLWGISSCTLYLFSWFLLTGFFLGKIKLKNTFIWFLVFLPILSHVITLYYSIEYQNGQNINILNMASLITGSATLFISIALFRLPVMNLLILMQPLSFFGIVLVISYPLEHIIQTRLFPLQLGHILISVLGDGLILLATLQALMISLQEHFLRKRPEAAWTRAHPPILGMEKILFELIWVGLIVLTLSVLSGTLAWNQKTPDSVIAKSLLSLGAWLVFSIIVLGRKYFGWRASPITTWISFGLILLVAAYFGTYFL